jgi:hypothetical protein
VVYNEREGPLPVHAIVGLLVDTILKLERVYMVIDALDEIEPDEQHTIFEFLNLLLSLHGKSDCRIVVTSRSYPGIVAAMSRIPHSEIDIKPDMVGDDIQNYITYTLANTKQLRVLPPEYKDLITQKLTEESSGM